jgi:hypothetical protein
MCLIKKHETLVGNTGIRGRAQGFYLSFSIEHTDFMSGIDEDDPTTLGIWGEFQPFSGYVFIAEIQKGRSHINYDPGL